MMRSTYAWLDTNSQTGTPMSLLWHWFSVARFANRLPDAGRCAPLSTELVRILFLPDFRERLPGIRTGARIVWNDFVYFVSRS